MDYKTALESRISMGEVFIVQGIKFGLFLTPASDKDFNDYVKAFDIKSFTDESAVDFCTDGQYEVRAIRIEDGVLKWEFPEIQQL